MRLRLLTVAALLVAFPDSPAHAQEEDVRSTVDWRVLRAGVFDVHYPGDDFLQRAREVAAWLQEADRRLARDLDFKLDGPINVILNRSRTEANQRFFVEDNPGEMFGIVCDSRHRRIIVPLVPSNRAMQRTLEHQLGHIYVEQCHFGRSSLSSSILDYKNSLYADWIREGIAGWASRPYDPAEEMLVRDAVLDGELPRLSAIHSFESQNVHERYQLIMESTLAVEWIQDSTPRGSAKRLLHVFNSDLPWPTARLVKRACGMTYNEVEAGFEEAMKQRYRDWAAGKEEAETFSRRLIRRGQYYRHYELAPAFSPDGRRLAYFCDRDGYFEIRILDLATGGEEAPLSLLLHVTIDAVRPQLRGIDWAPDGRSICFVGDRLGRPWLFIKPLDGGTLQRIRLPFDDVAQPQYSPDGRQILLVGYRNGYADLYLMDLESVDVRRLSTKDWPESDPAWSPDGKSIVFAGETDGQLDIWKLDVATRQSERLTATPANETNPAWRPDGAAVTFVSDAGGAPNLYTLDLSRGEVTRHTDVPGGAISPRWSPDGEEIVFCSFRHGRFTLVAMPPRAASAPAAPDDATRARNAAHFTLSQTEDYEIRPYEPKLQFESILPTGAKISDLFGHHQVDTDVKYRIRSGGYDLGGEITYKNRLLRPDIIIKAGAETSRDPGGTETSFGGEVGISYPIDRFTRASLTWLIREQLSSSRSTSDSDAVRSSELQSGFRLVAARRDVVRRRDNPISGFSVSASVEWMIPALASDVNRITYGADARLYYEVLHDHVVAARIAATHATGPDRSSLSLKDLVRGYSSGPPNGNDVVTLNLEYRFPLWRDLNWPLPGQIALVKDIRGVLFADIGVISGEENVMNMLAYPVRDEWHYSAGVTLQFDVYILENKYVPLLLTLSKVLDRTVDAPAGLKYDLTFDLGF